MRETKLDGKQYFLYYMFHDRKSIRVVLVICMQMCCTIDIRLWSLEMKMDTSLTMERKPLLPEVRSDLDCKITSRFAIVLHDAWNRSQCAENISHEPVPRDLQLQKKKRMQLEIFSIGQ